VVPRLVTTPVGAADAVTAANGTLVYLDAAGAAFNNRSLVWVDRQGREEPVEAPVRGYMYPRISPDGRRAAVFVGDQETDVWVWELTRRTLTRFTFGPAYDGWPVWTPDGQRILFASERGGHRNLYAQAADGTGSIERLSDTANQQQPTSVTPDGMRLIFHQSTPTAGIDIMQLTLDGAHTVTPLVQTPFTERNATVSPDGRWLAYDANDSGQEEIYVRPFPDVNGGRWLVSTGGGTRPSWTRDGSELFYLAGGALMRVAVDKGPGWTAGTATKLLEGPYFTSEGNPGRTYDISPDGKRFLMIKQAGSEQAVSPPQIIVVQNWHEELKRLVPTN
jgi:serine/threonine-protein kinase